MSRLDDIAIARSKCNPYLNKRVVGQYLDTKTTEGLRKYQAGEKLTRVHNLGMSFKGKSNSDGEYWKELGKKVATEGDNAGLWCDQSAALIVHLLTNDAKFTSPLEVVSQGDPKVHGHWYVIANRPQTNGQDDQLDWSQPFHEDSFVIDIWGALRNKGKDTVSDSPPTAFFDCSAHGPADIWAKKFSAGSSNTSAPATYTATKKTMDDKANVIKVVCRIT